MDNNIFIKILSLLNKPIHYFFVGTFCIFWNCKFEREPSYILFTGAILVLLALATFIENIVKKIKEQNLKTLNKNKVINMYNHLPEKELGVINYCIEQQYPVYQGDIYDDEAIVSLCAAGFGTSQDSYETFILNQNYFEWLSEYFSNKNGGGKNDKK